MSPHVVTDNWFGTFPETDRNAAGCELSTLMKLASIAVHVDEYLGGHGHAFDERAIRSLLDDEDVRATLRDMRKSGLVPKPRRAR